MVKIWLGMIEAEHPKSVVTPDLEYLEAIPELRLELQRLDMLDVVDPLKVSVGSRASVSALESILHAGGLFGN